MIKLYKMVDGRLHYHEAWTGDDVIIEHWGQVGKTGETYDHPLPSGGNEEEQLLSVLEEAIADGYRPIEHENLAILLVEYAIDGFGTNADLDKRHELEDRLQNALGWTGLGHVDGGSIGSGTMEACCYVVDFSIARAVIEKDLRGTEFADYSRIYEEGAE